MAGASPCPSTCASCPPSRSDLHDHLLTAACCPTFYGLHLMPYYATERLAIFSPDILMLFNRRLAGNCARKPHACCVVRQVVSVTFHEHHVPASSAQNPAERAMSLRRSSSLGDLMHSSAAAKHAAAAKRPHSRAAGVLATQAPSDSGSALAELEGGSGGRGALYCDAGVSRCCVMEIDAVNCSDTALQV